MENGMRRINCRDHGGTFHIPNGRGRPPVRCGGKYSQCSAVNTRLVGKTKATEVADVTKNRRSTAPVPSLRDKRNADALETAKRRVIGAEMEKAVARAFDDGAAARRKAHARVPESPTETPKPGNVSLPKAIAAKAELEPLGWAVSGRAWIDEEGNQCASVLANRGTETISLVWKNGTLSSQEYVLWNREKPSLNFSGMPPRRLKFDPDELSDRELVTRLSGMKVSWWNRLAKSVETAVIGDRVTIEHVYNSRGDETPGERIVKFVDHGGTGYRAFYAAALIKVG